jgi:hypothetical protein
MPIIPATLKVEAGRSELEASLGKVSETLIQKNTRTPTQHNNKGKINK